eukprot:gene1179-1332_t
MHYLGMEAQVFAVRMEYNIGIIAASVIIAVVVSMVAFWIMFRLLPLFPSMEILRVGSALVMGVAVCGMHYTGMYAPTYYTTSESSKAVSFAIGFETAVLTALLIGLICLMVVIIFCLMEFRSRSFHCTMALYHIRTNMERHLATPGLSPEVINILLQFEELYLKHYSVKSSVNKRASAYSGISRNASSVANAQTPQKYKAGLKRGNSVSAGGLVGDENNRGSVAVEVDGTEGVGGEGGSGGRSRKGGEVEEHKVIRNSAIVVPFIESSRGEALGLVCLGKVRARSRGGLGA